MKSSMRWRSAASAKPHHAGAAYNSHSRAMVVALVTSWRAAGGIPCAFRIRNVTEGIERSGTRLQNLGDVGSCAEVTGQHDSKYSFIHSSHFYSAPSSPLLLGGAPDYSTDTVSEFHAEAHEVSCQFVSASCFVGLTGTYRHEKALECSTGSQ